MSDTLDARQAEIKRLIEENSALEDLQNHPGWHVFTRIVQDWLRSHEDRLMSGNVEDLLEYKLLSGRISGLRQVFSVPEVAARSLEAAKNPPEQWQDELEHLDDAEYAPLILE